MPEKIVAVPIERCLASRELGEPKISPKGTCVVFTARENNASELRVVALPLRTGEMPTEQILVSTPQPATGRGFGGGSFAWLPDGSGIIYCAREAGLYELVINGSEPRRIDAANLFGPLSAIGVSDDGVYVSAVSGLSNVVVVTRSTGETTTISQPHAFTFDPVWHNDVLFWQAWSQPHMPWDETEIWCARSPHFVAQCLVKRNQTSFQQVNVSADGVLGLLADKHGWLRPHHIKDWVASQQIKDEEIVPLPNVGEDAECGGAQWAMGMHSWSWSPDATKYVVARNLGGFGDLAVVDSDSGELQTLARGVHGAVQWNEHGIVAVRTGAVTPTQIVFFSPDHFERTMLATSEVRCDEGPWSSFALVEPTIGTVANGAVNIPYRLYEPVGEVSARTLLVWIHGGPTDQWQVTFNSRIAYWVGQGCAVLVVDHRGTAGHGRVFQQALNGHWGEFDTDDVVAVVRHAHEQGWGASARTVVMGGSAGGFVALNFGGVAPELCRGVVASYPVVDLVDATNRSWDFEKHSIACLVGDEPDNLALYEKRSPLSKIDNLIKVKVLLMHGDMDEAVPLDHSVTIAQKIRKHGGDVSLHVFEGEGHGFRQKANQLLEYRLIGEFIAAM